MRVELRNPRRRLEFDGPMAIGNRHLAYKEALSAIEVRSPGTKQAFYFGFQARTVDLFADSDDGAIGPPGECERCGVPCSNEVCAFCRLLERVGGALPESTDPAPALPTPAVPAPVVLDPTQGRSREETGP
jgi:hypothetical protein